MGLMDMNFVVAQGFGVLSMVSSICSMQFKKRKQILIALLCLSVFAALNLIFLGSLSAAYITLFAILEMLVNYLFERREKTVPKWVVGIYVVCNVALGALTWTGVLDVLPILAAIVFCFSLLAKKEQNIRKLMFVNQLLWLIFDATAGAYALVASNVLTLISTSVAIYRYGKKGDKIKVKKGSSNDKRKKSKTKR